MSSTLQETLRFDDDDLATNRAGMLSRAQVERLARERRRALLVSGGALAAIALAAAALLFIAQQGGSWVVLLIGIALTVINALIMARAVQSWLRMENDLRRGEVEVIEGTARRTVRIFGRLPVFVIALDDREVVVTKDVFNAITEGGRYRFYRAQSSGALLTAEAVQWR